MDRPTVPHRRNTTLALGTVLAVGTVLLSSATTAVAAQAQPARTLAASGSPADCAAGQVSSSAQTVLDDLSALTQTTQSLQAPANQLNSADPTSAMAVTNGLAGLANTAGQDVTQMGQLQPFTDPCDAAAVAGAYQTFATVTQNLLDTLTDKAPTVTQPPSNGTPIAAALRSYESTSDSLGLELVNLTPSQTQTSASAQQLDASFQTTITAYS